MTPAPIVLFTYNRLKPTIRLIQSLKRNELAKDSKLYIFSDGAKENSYLEVSRVRDYLRTVEGFGGIEIFESFHNYGCARSVIDGVTQVLRKHDRAIVLEDDLLVSDNFLSYMNEALEFYEDLPVWAISGWGMDLKFHPLNKADVYYSPRGNSWGWATWRKRWQSVDWQVKDYATFDREAFAEAGDDLPGMLDKQMAGKIDSWSIRFDYAQHKSNLLNVYPKVSKVLHEGFDGTHTKIDPGYPVTLDISGKTNFNFMGMRDKDIDKQFRSYFGKWFKIKNRVRRMYERDSA